MEFGTQILKKLSGKLTGTNLIKINQAPDSHLGLLRKDEVASDEERYNWQMSVRANYLLLEDDKAKLKVDISTPPHPLLDTTLRWINRGETIAGSFMCGVVPYSSVPHADIDIYFKCKEDVNDFMRSNRNMHTRHVNEVLTYTYAVEDKKYEFNLIHGIPYNDPEDLISRFDIRACSIALNPCTNTLYSVSGSFSDIVAKRITYNPIPRGTTIARLIKYIQKGFIIDAHQRLFLSELIRSNQYNPEIELMTGYKDAKE